jgi:hypothetical protein
VSYPFAWKRAQRHDARPPLVESRGRLGAWSARGHSFCSSQAVFSRKIRGHYLYVTSPPSFLPALVQR